jgi:hypothetical protein
MAHEDGRAEALPTAKTPAQFHPEDFISKPSIS